jgi:dihydrofolate reductase
MKVTLFMAISLNGIIARENNEEDFLSNENWQTLVKLTHETECVIWGRKTHDVVKTWGKEYWDQIKKVRKIIVSSEKNLELEETCTQTSSPREALEKLSSKGFKSVILSGGSTLNSSFLKEGLIDEIIFNIEPAVIGKGIPVFKFEGFDNKRLKLLEMKKLEEGIVQLHYKVLK